MSTWNKLFLNEENIQLFPQTEIIKFALIIKNKFPKITNPKVWDICSGAGRHSVFLAKNGFKVHATDESENGINFMNKWLNKEKLSIKYKKADMTINPWGNNIFHAAFSWNGIYHNTIDNIRIVENNIYNSLIPEGLFLINLLSTNAFEYDNSKEIEKNTFIDSEGLDAGVPHHFFDYEEIKSVFNRWKVKIICEQVANYIEKEEYFYMNNPFSYTKWYVLLEK